MICFAWSGFPQYAARCVGAFVAASSEKVVVVATRPRVPIEGMENLCKCDIVWIEPDDLRSSSELLGDVPRVLLVSGWSIPLFNRLRQDVRRVGGKIIGMVDHNFVPSLKECIRALRFRLLLRDKFDGFFVPGNAGIRLLRFYGVNPDKIETGMYSADSSLFVSGNPLSVRDRRIIYVGQFIRRKNVQRMVRAFLAALSSRRDGWELHLYGCGPLKQSLEEFAGENVHIHSFVQPEQLASLYQEARAFCLPSLEEHWGLVVHEAALSGCFLLLSKAVGAAEDLLGVSNGIVFDPTNDSSMVKAFCRIMDMPENELERAHEESVYLANNVSLRHFVKGVMALIGK